MVFYREVIFSRVISRYRFLFKSFVFVLIMRVSVCEQVPMTVRGGGGQWHLNNPPRTGVRGTCEISAVGAGN